jgi:uncharacterized protein (TIGR02444 family)
MNNVTLNNPFWQFACDFYSQPDAAEALLCLQDKHLLNINILLLLIWLGEQGLSINKYQLDSLLVFNMPMDNNIISPLRKARTALKFEEHLKSYYKTLKQLELALEQEAIRNLYQHSQTIIFSKVETSCSKNNLSVYVLEQSAAFDALNRVLQRYNRQKQ